MGAMTLSGAQQMTSREIAELRQRLMATIHYDGETGIFTSKVDRVKWRVGTPVGTVRANGYVQICVDRKLYYAHRLAILFATGAFPSFAADHINGDKADNRISNLRCASRSINAQNRIRHNANCVVDMLGVKLANQKSGFVATISACGKVRHLGTYATKEAAHSAYVAAKRELHPGCTL